MTNDRKKEYRILAIAVAFFLVGLFFFWHNNTAPATPTPAVPPPSNPAKPTVSIQPAGSSGLPLNSPFVNFPPPSGFRTFTDSGTSLNGSSSLTIAAICHAAYVAVLIFPATVDYRENMARAVFNEAVPCDSGKPFSLVIHPADLGHAPTGTYYFFTADQGMTGTWYNPI